MKVECPDCGRFYERTGMGAHRGALPCQAEACARALRKEGYEKCSATSVTRHLVRKAPTGFRAGGRDVRAKITTQQWLPTWAIRMQMLDCSLKQIEEVEGNRDLQIAYGLEFSILQARSS